VEVQKRVLGELIIPALELVSKPQIMFEGKAQVDEKAQSAKVLWRMSSTF
jgi:hypothetical protein